MTKLPYQELSVDEICDRPQPPTYPFASLRVGLLWRWGLQVRWARPQLLSRSGRPSRLRIVASVGQLPLRLVIDCRRWRLSCKCRKLDSCLVLSSMILLHTMLLVFNFFLVWLFLRLGFYRIGGRRCRLLGSLFRFWWDLRDHFGFLFSLIQCW